MLHEDKEEFLKVLERTSGQTGFPLRLLEKDYYLTIILSQINSLSPDLILKGGTCLNKVYFSYYRLSEDLDFTLKLPSDTTTRTMRRKAIQPIKDSIKDFAKSFGLKIRDEAPGHKESSQYIYYFIYQSVVLNKEESIKLEIGLRFNPLLPTEDHLVKHVFLHPFTGKPLFDSGKVSCLCLKELVAEKMRAAATRIDIAARDFFDLDFLLKQGFNFKDKEFLSLFKKKLAEDSFPTDLKKYSHNLGRTDEEIKGMQARLEDELFPVLTFNSSKTFNLQEIFRELNKVFGHISK